jgi:maltoporin
VVDTPRKSAGGFAFGSYGRTIAATDFRGRPGRDADIVARGSRLDEGNYVELELRREDYWAKTDSTTRVVATLAVQNPVFHYTGDFDIKMAVRNLYLESRDLGFKGLSVWAGSRMYRGDDVYLLDWWPLDNLNTLGGGARFDFLKATSVALHSGVSQPTSDFYFQEARRSQVFNQTGGTNVKVLDRQRSITSLKLSHIFFVGETGGIKLAAYGEAHILPQGQRESRAGVFETLPSDSGYVVGGQIGGFTGKRDTHLNLFFRYARGLAAYGEFTTPTGLAADKTSSGAREIRVAAGGNWEMGPVGVMLGAYIRSFRNASPDLDFHDLDEGIVALRPHVFFGEIGGLAVEGSYQAQQRAVLAPPEEGATGSAAQPQGPLKAHVWRVGVIPFLSPAGRGDYSRPQIRLIYTLAARNKAAKSLYPQDDVFSLRDMEHFFGFGVEWWFNASWTYGG